MNELEKKIGDWKESFYLILNVLLYMFFLKDYLGGTTLPFADHFVFFCLGNITVQQCTWDYLPE